MSTVSEEVPRSRVVRRNVPRGKITRSNYRKRALPSLLKDFEHRCAYSMLHEDNGGGRSAMDVDHFDPRIKDKYNQPYSNLFLACRHCNGKKQDLWPTPEMRKKEIRFLDCTKEFDYGLHIFEDPVSHKVFGTTPAGVYHVRVMDLNADVFVKHRQLRAEVAEARAKTPQGSIFKPIRDVSEKLANIMIPMIPYAVPPLGPQ